MVVDESHLIKIALVGQPNVGKSSLFNRIAQKRVAIVSEQSGTTRDIKKHKVDILGHDVMILDTGGIEKRDDLIFSNVKRKSLQIAKEADMVLFMVDGKQLPNEEDKTLFYQLQRLNKPLALVVNKIDNDNEMTRLWEFFEFGIDQKALFGISVSHNRNIKPLFDWILQQLALHEKEQLLLNNQILDQESLDSHNDDEDDDIKVAIIGKVNVGKSSLLNALLGQERSVVSEVAGTTIDPVDETFEYQDKRITFVDTAGLRRRGRIEGIEKFALLRTKEMLQKASLALFVMDATQPISQLDEKIAGLVDEFALGTIIVLNKWDEKAQTFEKIEEEVRIRFRFLYYAPIIAVSAKTGRSVDRLKESLVSIYDNYTQRITTSHLNELIETAVRRHSLPSPNGVFLKIYYATQFETKPPRIALIMNKPKLLHFSYKRYLIRFLRDHLNLLGIPVHIVARTKGQREALDDKTATPE